MNELPDLLATILSRDIAVMRANECTPADTQVLRVSSVKERLVLFALSYAIGIYLYFILRLFDLSNYPLQGLFFEG